MSKVNYFTLAAARRENSDAFDAAIKKAVKDAASDVGDEIVIQALCQPIIVDTKKVELVA